MDEQKLFLDMLAKIAGFTVGSCIGLILYQIFM